MRRKNRVLEMEIEILKRASAYCGRTCSQIGFRLVQEIAADGFDVAVTCRVLQVSRSGYYDWLRPPSLARCRSQLTGTITRVHLGSRGTYGAPRVHAELRLGLGIGSARNGSPG